MNSLQRFIHGVLLLGLLLPHAVSYSQDNHEGLEGRTFELSEAVTKKAVDSISGLKVGSYNLRNLFEKSGKIHDRTAQIFSIITRATAPLEEPLKSLEELKAQGRAILENDFDILAVEEIENLKALGSFSKEFLGSQYNSYLIEGNDPRGIDVGFLVKASLPFEVEQRTHKNETWSDPIAGGKTTRLFSRDLPALLFRTDKKAAPFLIYFGTHFKSKRDRPKDPESRILRKAQVERASEIVKAYEAEFGAQTPIFLAGDFNGEIAHEKEFVSLSQVASLHDTFDVVSPPLSQEERVTHTFFPKDGKMKRSQLDAVLVNAAAAKFIQDAKVYRYKDSNGEELPLPSSFQDVMKNPSDHFPVQADLDFKKLGQ
ncbi:MAG: hypothetical protein EBQ85_01675 [Proteobacteria bacterium]|nr:hypothetical protein [Pseudomonadota bacterium]